MKQRVVTAVIALLFFIPLLYLGGIALQVVTLLMAGIGVFELFRMKDMSLQSTVGILTIIGTVFLVLPQDPWFTFLGENYDKMGIFYLMVVGLLVLPVATKNKLTFDDIGFPLLVSFYVGMGFHQFLMARTAGIAILMLALLIVWATDIGAYTFGRALGKHKLAPAISPNKSIEGAVGGVVSAVIVAVIYTNSFLTDIPLWQMGLLTIIFSITAQLGDLVQSAYKRHYGVKDAGNLLPGHGGILDRFDSMLFVFPIMHLFGLF